MYYILVVREQRPVPHAGACRRNLLMFGVAGACWYMKPVWSVCPVRGSYTSRCGRCVVSMACVWSVLAVVPPVRAIINVWCGRCVMIYEAGLVSMSGAWFLHWPVRPERGLYRPLCIICSMTLSTTMPFIFVVCY